MEGTVTGGTTSWPPAERTACWPLEHAFSGMPDPERARILLICAKCGQVREIEGRRVRVLSS